MRFQKKLILTALFFLLVPIFLAPNVDGKDKEFDALVRHVQSTYKGKKVKIPFMWLARFAVKIVKPAGVKSFNFTIFENLEFSAATLDAEMQAAMRNSLSSEWIPLMRVRSRSGEQLFAYMRENGKDIKLLLVTIERDQAAVIRATFNPEKLAEFIDNPKIFGISLGDRKENTARAAPVPVSN